MTYVVSGMVSVEAPLLTVKFEAPVPADPQPVDRLTPVCNQRRGAVP